MNNDLFDRISKARPPFAQSKETLLGNDVFNQITTQLPHWAWVEGTDIVKRMEWCEQHYGPPMVVGTVIDDKANWDYMLGALHFRDIKMMMFYKLRWD